MSRIFCTRWNNHDDYGGRHFKCVDDDVDGLNYCDEGPFCRHAMAPFNIIQKMANGEYIKYADLSHEELLSMMFPQEQR